LTTNRDIWNRIEDILKEEKIHMTLIDPDKQEPETAGEMARSVTNAGSDAIMVGGSTGVSQEKLDATVLAIKAKTDLPIILFPTSSSAISPHAHAIYFMSLLNSSNPRFLIREHRDGAMVIKKLGLEPIPMGYIIVEPGMKVGQVSGAEFLSKSNIKDAVGYALSAEFLGMKLVYFEAGSGSPDVVPLEMVKAVKKEVTIPLVGGGGIKTPEMAKRLTEAGADIIVTGTVVEETENIEDTIGNIISAIKSISIN